MKIHCKYDELVDVDLLVPHKRNANKHPDKQIKMLAKIIDHQGWRHPVIVSNLSGFVVAGHGRLESAKLNGYESVPVVRQDFVSEAAEFQFLISDNKIAELAEHDDAFMIEGIDELDLNDSDFELLGIDDFELPIDPDAAKEEIEDDVPTDVETRVKPGDLWILGEHRLLCGDSTNIQHVERLMGGMKADMVFTDPPYGVDYKGINNDSRDGLEDLLSSAFSNYFITSKSGASIYVFHSDKCADIFHKCFREHFHFSSMIIWNKNSLTLSRTDYQSKHEPCLYGWMNNGTHFFHGDRKQTSVWDISKERVEGHTTPKPVEVIERALSNSSKSGDLITDLFGGSGSTLIACEKTNRKCYMAELDPHYCSVILERWEKYSDKKAVLDSNG